MEPSRPGATGTGPSLAMRTRRRSTAPPNRTSSTCPWLTKFDLIASSSAQSSTSSGRRIDDPDEGVYAEVRGRIVELGDHVVPVLERAWEFDDLGDLFRDRIEDILHTIHLAAVNDRLKAWKATGGEDLLEGALIISRYRYPDMDEQKVKARLASIRQDIWLELNDATAHFGIHAFVWVVDQGDQGTDLSFTHGRYHPSSRRFGESIRGLPLVAGWGTPCFNRSGLMVRGRCL